MRFRTLARAAVIGICLGGGAIAVDAESRSSGHPGVDARKLGMKALGRDLNKVKAFVQGKGGDTATVAAAAASIAANAAEIQHLFDDQIHTDNAEDVRTTSHADIWVKWGEFRQIGYDLEVAAVALAAAAATGDAEAIEAAFGATAKTCGACHKPFRQQ